MSYVYDENAKMVDFRDTEEKMRDFFREGHKNLSYPTVLRRIAEDDHILEALFELAQIDYTVIYSSQRASELTMKASAIQTLIQDIVEEMIVEGDIRV